MTDMNVVTIPLEEIHYDESFNCRGAITPLDVVDLAKDIDLRGLIQPVVVRPDTSNPKYKYLLIAGYRRFTAFKVLGKAGIPAVINDTIEDEMDARLFNLSENLQRKELNIYQEAKALEKLMMLGLGEFEAAGKLNKSRGWIQIRYMVLKLPDEIQQEIAAGFFNQPQIRDIYTHFSRHGKEASFVVAREFKDDKIKGRKGTRRKPKKDTEKEAKAKRHRNRAEIFDAQDRVREDHGNSIITRTLAWCAGEITSHDFDRAIAEFYAV